MATHDGVPLSVGLAVEAKFRGVQFMPGHVTNVRADGTCDIAYNDGEMMSGEACADDSAIASRD